MDSIIFKAISDVGLIRDNNEDSFIAELLWDDHHILCAAIDGVGETVLKVIVPDSYDPTTAGLPCPARKSK